MKIEFVKNDFGDDVSYRCKPFKISYMKLVSGKENI